MQRYIIRTWIAAAALLALSAAAYSYATYAKWPSSPVIFYVNPANADVSQAAAVNALQYAMNVWNQGGTSFRFNYGGTTNATTTGYDNRNVIVFRNSTNGSAIATTYSWATSSQQLVDTDIIFWDKGYRFFTGTSGCGGVSNAVYVEDVAAHELGHALGLRHSSVSGATMYPSYSYCSQAFRTLSSDDVAGLKSLYPSTTKSTANTAPTVTITSPVNGATVTVGSSVSLSATATDSQDGNLTSRITWTDNGTAIGTGGLLSKVWSVAGGHVLVARVTDNGGLQGSKQVSITVAATTTTTTTTTGSLSVRARDPGSDIRHRVNMAWSGVAGTNVDVYRNGVLAYQTVNDGSGIDYPGTIYPNHATHTYKLCKTGTTTCTNTSSVTF